MAQGDPTYRELLRGKGEHADPVASRADVPAEAAGRLVPGYPHSIWQIVSHMNYWMDCEWQRIAGAHPAYPEHAIQSWPGAQVKAVATADASQLSTVQAVLWQTLVHNSYHIGQITLLLRCFGLWPPKTGADTW